MFIYFNRMSELGSLSGIGKKREEALASAGVHTLRDLIYYLPRKFIDRTRFKPIRSLQAGEDANFWARITSVEKRGARQGERLIVEVQDDTGRLDLVFFNGVRFLEKRFSTGQRLHITGTPTLFNRLQIVHPETVLLGEEDLPEKKVLPVYPLTEEMLKAKIDHRRLQKAALETLEKFEFTDPLSGPIRKELRLMSEKMLLSGLHHPESMKAVPRLFRQVRTRELLPVCFRLEAQRRQRAGKGRSTVGDGRLMGKILKSLPFQLTPGQKTAFKGIMDGLSSPGQFQGLLQGDVGSGKTVTVLLACAAVLEAGRQAAIMTPTEILAMQHARSINKMLEGTGESCALLLGSTPAAERKKILAGLASGDIRLITGTHVLYSADVKYRDLGLAVIDEQHKYGVKQRAAIAAKGDDPDILHMSATPIPRTLTHTLYGDLDNLVLSDMPPGRKPVKTRLVPFGKRNDMLKFILEQSKQGEQVYWVVPRIAQPVDQNRGDSLQEDDAGRTDLKSLEKLFSELSAFSCGWRLGLVHGQLSPEEKEKALSGFQRGDINILVATTVIEVGIDVPNANTIIIENPDRFGLAQLHQLRGRVGRGGKQAWCFLALPVEDYPEPTMEKLQMFRETADGFAVAELDLKFRGTGDVEGIRQSGFAGLKYTDLIRDFKQVMELREFCARSLET